MAWVLPWLLKLSTNEASRYPFSYYSCIKEEFIHVTSNGKDVQRIDQSGNIYTRDQYDSLLPMLNYRQLLSDGKLPDTIKGRKITAKDIQHEQFFFKYNPREKNSQLIDLNPMFESMSGLVRLESPDDMFSIKDKMVFIDAETNTINKEKSAEFHDAMIKRGYTFPTQLVAGNPSTKKPYDEGWFALDAKGQLFHIKMVNGKPFVKNTNAQEHINIAYVKTIETANRRMYAFVFDKNGSLFYLQDLDYQPIKINIAPFDCNNDNLAIYANQFYWCVFATTDKERVAYALDNESLNIVDTMVQKREITRWEKIHPYIFPFYIEMQSSNSTFVYPRLLGWSYKAIFLNIIFTILLVVLIKRRKLPIQPFHIVWVILTGTFGFIAYWCFNEKTQETKNVIQLK